MPSRNRWDANAAVITETRAVQQDGETDLQFEHRNFKIALSQAIIDWAAPKGFCSTYNQFVREWGLASTPNELGGLRGEDTAEAFEEWKAATNRRINQTRNSQGYRDETEEIVRNAGLDPNVGLPRRVTVTYKGTFEVPHTFEVNEGDDVLARARRGRRFPEALYHAATSSDGGVGTVTYEVEVQPEDAPTS